MSSSPWRFALLDLGQPSRAPGPRCSSAPPRRGWSGFLSVGARKGPMCLPQQVDAWLLVDGRGTDSCLSPTFSGSDCRSAQRAGTEAWRQARRQVAPPRPQPNPLSRLGRGACCVAAVRQNGMNGPRNRSKWCKMRIGTVSGPTSLVVWGGSARLAPHRQQPSESRVSKGCWLRTTLRAPWFGKP